ncbi:MAG: MBL fold metallo-hydrolase [Patescibacteria group bacterium]
MYIYWYGQAGFKLQSGDTTIVVDPYSPRKAGLRGPNFKSDIVLLTESSDISQAKKDFKGGAFLISSPGEYEIKNNFIYGIKLNETHAVYLLEMDGVKIGVLGELKNILDENTIEKLDDVDVLLAPVGNKKSVLAPEQAAKLIRDIEPKIIIPSCYKIPGLKIEAESIDKFYREMGLKNPEVLDKARITVKDLEGKEMAIIVLNPS